jgi:hypothetical protein
MIKIRFEVTVTSNPQGKDPASEQRNDQASRLLGVLGKMADALHRIADKL